MALPYFLESYIQCFGQHLPFFLKLFGSDFLTIQDENILSFCSAIPLDVIVSQWPLVAFLVGHACNIAVYDIIGLRLKASFSRLVWVAPL